MTDPEGSQFLLRYSDFFIGVRPVKRCAGNGRFPSHFSELESASSAGNFCVAVLKPSCVLLVVLHWDKVLDVNRKGYNSSTITYARIHIHRDPDKLEHFSVRMNLSPLNTAAKYGSSVVQDVQGSAETEWSREVFHELDLNTMKALSDCGDKATNADNISGDQDFLQTETLAGLTSIIAADPELSANPLACRKGQTAAASLLYTLVLDSRSIKLGFLQEPKFLSGLVLMVDEGSPAMQLTAARLLAKLASDTATCKAICQVQGGLVIAMMLKTTWSAEGRAAAADCLIKLLPHLTPLEHQIVRLSYPKPLHPPAND